MTNFTEYTNNLSHSLEQIDIIDRSGHALDIQDGLTSIINSLNKIKTTHNKVLIIGNGGSAAIASHLQNDLCKGAHIRAMVFTEPPLLTALSNDISYNAAYRELISLWADKNDILIAISSSGRSQNIIDAANTARDLGCNPIISISGFLSDNPLRRLGDINIYISSKEYGNVELAHSTIVHYISDQTLKSDNII